MSKSKRPAAVKVGNRDLCVAMQEKRRSNATVPQADRRTRRNRSRAAQRANSIEFAR